MLASATPRPTHAGPVFSTPPANRPRRYLSPNRTPVQEDNLQVFSESKLYEKYFAPFSLPNPPQTHQSPLVSHKRRRARSPTPPRPVRKRPDAPESLDPFAMDDDAPKTEELVLQRNPRVTLQLPNRLLSRAEWTQLILDASSRVVESLNVDTKRAEYKRGMRRLAEICMSSFVASNAPSVLPHPQLHPTIKTILLGMCPEIRVTVPLNLPATFDELDEFIGQLENQKLWILGMLAGEKVLLTMSSEVPM
jgi:hypothetical protein